MQIAEINVDGKMLAFKASGMTQITYDSLFRGRNFINDIMSLRDIRSDIDAAGDDISKVNISTDDLRVFANVCYTMRYQAMSSSEKRLSGSSIRLLMIGSTILTPSTFIRSFRRSWISGILTLFQPLNLKKKKRNLSRDKCRHIPSKV